VVIGSVRDRETFAGRAMYVFGDTILRDFPDGSAGEHFHLESIEMACQFRESRVSRCSGLSPLPAHSTRPHYGHTSKKSLFIKGWNAVLKGGDGLYGGSYPEGLTSFLMPYYRGNAVGQAPVWPQGS